MTDIQKKYYSLTEVTKRCSVCKATLYRHKKRGLIKFNRRCGKNDVYIDDLHAYENIAFE